MCNPSFNMIASTFLVVAMNYQWVKTDHVYHMVGIIEINSYEIHSRIRWSYKGIYPLGSILSHSCIINTRHLIEKDSPFYNVCLATVFIPEGEN